MKRKHTNKHKSLNHNPQAESVKAEERQRKEEISRKDSEE
jgi:hypothetical protein